MINSMLIGMLNLTYLHLCYSDH